MGVLLIGLVILGLPGVAEADCPAAPLATATDMVISMKTANGVQVAPGDQLGSNVKEGMVVYDDANNALKLCDGTNWVSVGSGGGGTASAEGAAGYLQFSDGAGSLDYSGTTAGQQLFWDNTNKRLGIGTANPASILNLHGAASNTITMSHASAGYDTNITSAYNSAAPFLISSAGYQHYKFKDTDKSITVGSTGNTILRVEASLVPRLWFSGANGVDTVGFMAGLGSTANLGIYTGSSERVRIDAAGNVGIGTTTPGVPLHVLNAGSGNIQAETTSGTATAGLIAKNADRTWSARIRGDVNDGFSIADETAASHRLVIDTSGNVGIGTTAPDASALLDVSSTAKGLLPPRMTTAQVGAIASPAAGLMVFNTDTAQLEFWNGTAWTGVGSMTAGTIAAFALTSCPSGWTEYTAARGRFLRGIDNGAGTDPAGTRAPGNAQSDAFQGHGVGLSAYEWNLGNPGGSGVLYYTRNSNGNMGTQAIGPGNSVFYDNGSGAPRTAVETRPANVAVIYCQYSGSGGGGGGSGVTDGDKGDITVSGTGASWMIDDDVLNFTELSDTLTLDASTDIAASGTNALSITNTGTGLSLRVNDAASDTTPFVIDAAGNVGIGTASPGIALDVVGAIASRVVNDTAGTSFDFTTGNAHYTSAVCGAFTLSGMVDGGNYSLLVTGSGTGPATFTHSGLTLKTTGTLTCTTAKHTLFGFQRFGANVYVTMVPGY